MFDRLELLIGKNIKHLTTKTIMLFGLGGVGGYAFETLVRSGIGTIIVIDNDVIDKTNLNRQILSSVDSIGKYKVDVAESRKNEINPDCNIIKIKKFITKDNLNNLFDYNPDFIIDAIDTVQTKKLIIKESLQRKIKFISVMGTGGKMDATKLQITDLSKTTYDPIAKILRVTLKKEKIRGKIPVISSTEITKTSKPIGSNAFVPAVAGILCTNYVINEILKETK